jgi:Ca-activated chloride channel family protein
VHATSYALPDRDIIVPQSRVFSSSGSSGLEIMGVDVRVELLEQAATTTMEIGLRNPGTRRLDAELVVPVPDGAVVKGFDYQGAAKEPAARILRRDEARRIYEGIVARAKDPAMLEFVGTQSIRSSVFPVEPRGEQRIRLVYEHLLPREGNRLDYVLPRSESLAYTIPWNISVRIKYRQALSTVYSPSHELDTKRIGRHEVRVKTTGESRSQPGPFRLSCLLEGEGVTASLFAYPDPRVGGGYFLLLAGLPTHAKKERDRPAIRRSVTLVLDRSGSMGGEKIEQVREAAMQVISGLEEGEAFNLIVYNDTIDLYSAQPVIKTKERVKAARAYLDGVQARGGTNLHDALHEALRRKPPEGMLPMILFLTDGLPTVGQTSETAITDLAAKANPHQYRVFTFGVGVDVNAPLLDGIAHASRAASTYVLPGEDVEVKVAGVFKRLKGPVLAHPDLAAPGRVREVIPGTLPDLFEDDQLVVLGRYVGEQPLTFSLTGNYLGRKRAFTFGFELGTATRKNGFVPRLWASRKIALLTDAIRRLGAEPGTAPPFASAMSSPDSRLKELVEEIVRLSKEYGILTEYTAFLAREGTDLNHREAILAEADNNFRNRAMYTRTGAAGINQALNNNYQMAQQTLNQRNDYWDENLNRVSITNVQQINDLAFFRRGRQWIDSRLVNGTQASPPSRVIEFGSDAFRRLALELARDGRQGSMALSGDVLLQVNDETILIKGTGIK